MQIVNRFWQGAQKARELALRLPFLAPSAPLVPLLALPEPLCDRVIRAERIYGVHLSNDDGQALVRASGSPRSEALRAVGVSDTSPDLVRALQTGAPWLVFLSCAHRVNTRPFRAALESARKQMPDNAAFGAVLTGLSDWATPQPGAAHIVRCGILWTLAEMATKSVGSSALVDAYPVRYSGYGDLLSEVLHRRQNGVIHSDHPLIGVASQIELATDYLSVDSQIQAIWHLMPWETSALPEALQLDVDILTLLENVGGTLYATILLRSSGSLEQLAETEHSLAAFGSVRRIHGVELNGYGLGEAWRSFVPGGLKPKGDRFSVDDNEGFLSALVSGIDMKSATSGDTFVGSRDGRPVFIRRDTRASGAIIGISGSGKTTLASAIAMQGRGGPAILTVLFASKPNEAPPVWARAFGGQSLNLKLPAPASAEEAGFLIGADDWAKHYWEAFGPQWLHCHYPQGMPITLRLESGSPARFVAVAIEFLQGFIAAWRSLYEQCKAQHQPTPQGTLILDDVVLIGGHEGDAVLGELPRQLGARLRELIQQIADTGRSSGLVTIVTAHSEQEFKAWPDGFWGSLGFAIVLKPEADFSEAVLLDPALWPLDGTGGTLGGVIVPRLNVQLPRPVVEVLGQSLELPVHSGA